MTGILLAGVFGDARRAECPAGEGNPELLLTQPYGVAGPWRGPAG